MKRRFVTVLALTGLALAISYQLFREPILGIANNGSFYRLLWPAGLRALPATYEDEFWNYVPRTYAIDAPVYSVGYYSSELLFVYLSFLVNPSLDKFGFYDIR